MNVFAFLITHSLITFGAYPQDRATQCNFCDVVFNDTFVIANAINVRSIFFCPVQIAIDLYFLHYLIAHFSFRLVAKLPSSFTM